jgi:uncharacterized protein
MITFEKPIHFQWDQGNQDKNAKKHQITNIDAEQVFLDRNKKILKDSLHSNGEKRYIIIGTTKTDKKLFVAFTQRGKKIRIISARKLNKKEYKLLK